jgi:hypothetical protein
MKNKKEVFTVKNILGAGKVRNSQEELECVCAKLKAIQDGELDDATKEKICMEVFEDFHRNSVIAMHLAGEAVRDAENALEQAKEVFADKMRVLDVIADSITPTVIPEDTKEEILMNTRKKVIQDVKVAEEALKVCEEVSERVLIETEEIIFRGAEELKGTHAGETILMNVLESFRDFSSQWCCSIHNDAEAEEALREAIGKAERVLGKKIKSCYI